MLDRIWQIGRWSSTRDGTVARGDPPGLAASGLGLALAASLALILALLGGLSFQTLIPLFVELWGLSHGAAGWVASSSYIAYALASPFVVSATDRVDARWVFAGGSLALALAAFGFALFARDFWTALPWRALVGVGIAATYMPGLKALADRLRGRDQGRLQSLYTASYALGSALSVAASGLLADALGWRGAFAVIGALALLAGLLFFVAAGAKAPPSPPAPTAARLREVWRHRESRRYVLAYALHTFEMFAFRTWVVSFLSFSFAYQGQDANLAWLSGFATVILLLGLPAALLGNEWAERRGRKSSLRAIMLLSGLCALALALAVSAPVPLVLLLSLAYGALIMADSAAITVGTLAVAPASRRGATIAVQTFLAALAAMVSPLLFGYLLDAFGADRPLGWRAGFAATALVAVSGVVVLGRGR